jgi:hypothetical protein
MSALATLRQQECWVGFTHVGTTAILKRDSLFISLEVDSQ